MQPETRFAPVGEDRVAYQVLGDGRFDLVYCSGAWRRVECGTAIPS
jgi:hypothetical protein